ncbi:MAG TPA: hypothetical protein VL332_07995 [Candidatus Saccharimonadaceae bacterium]|jgi:hypothetical protein|nr:hypothetical protein [Candidatus Saccharimonadaceae bacterium]
MTRHLRVPLVVFVLLVAASPAFATKYAGEFMKIPVGARAIGMGGAFTAVCDDATAAFWNPAGLVYLPYREALFQHAEQFGSLENHDYLSAAYPLGGDKEHRSTFGVSLVRLAVDDIPITPRPSSLRPGVDFLDYGTDNDPTTPGNGQGNGVWDRGERLLLTSDDLYMASSADMAATVSYARQRGKHWTFGGNLKFVRQSIPDTLRGEHVTSFGAGLDVGANYMPTDAVTIGAVVHDLTTTYLSWSNGTHELVVPTLDTGAGFNFYPAERHALTWGFDLGWTFDGREADSEIRTSRTNVVIRTGLEYWYRNTLALRTGVNAKDLTFGVGVRYKQVGVDYAASLNRFFAADDPNFPSDQNLDASQLVSLAVNW